MKFSAADNMDQTARPLCVTGLLLGDILVVSASATTYCASATIPVRSALGPYEEGEAPRIEAAGLKTARNCSQ